MIRNMIRWTGGGRATLVRDIKRRAGGSATLVQDSKRRVVGTAMFVRHLMRLAAIGILMPIAIQRLRDIRHKRHFMLSGNRDTHCDVPGLHVGEGDLSVLGSSLDWKKNFQSFENHFYGKFSYLRMGRWWTGDVRSRHQPKGRWTGDGHAIDRQWNIFVRFRSWALWCSTSCLAVSELLKFTLPI